MVDFGELMDKAEDLAGKHPDQVDSAIDKAAGLLGGKVGHQAQVEQGADKLKDMLTGHEDAPKPHAGKRPGQAKRQGGQRAGKKPGAGKRASKPAE